MREARKNHGLVVVNSRIYAVGGQNGLGGFPLKKKKHSTDGKIRKIDTVLETWFGAKLCGIAKHCVVNALVSVFVSFGLILSDALTLDARHHLT